MIDKPTPKTHDIKALEEEVRAYELRARLSEAKFRIADAESKRRKLRDDAAD